MSDMDGQADAGIEPTTTATEEASPYLDRLASYVVTAVHSTLNIRNHSIEVCRTWIILYINNNTFHFTIQILQFLQTFFLESYWICTYRNHKISITYV